MVPSPKTTIFDTAHERLGTIAGPILLDVHDDVIWACDRTRLLRYAAERWTTSELPVAASFVLGISATEAIVGGKNRLGHTCDGGRSWRWEEVTPRWHELVCAMRDREGRFWFGSRNSGLFRASEPAGPLTNLGTLPDEVGSVRRICQLADAHAAVITDHLAFRVELRPGHVQSVPIFQRRASDLLDGAVDERGTISILSENKLWRSSGGPFVEMRVPGDKRFTTMRYVDERLVVLAQDGAMRVLAGGEKWKRFDVENTAMRCRLSSVARYGVGWLVGIERQDEAKSGALVYLGEVAGAPLVPASAPEVPGGMTFVLAERYALLWATAWQDLPDAEVHAAAWMKVASALAS